MSPRSLSWKLNWYRQSELEGALLLGKLIRTADDPGLVLPLTRHCSDEVRHALRWAETIDRLNLGVVRIFKSYQSYYTQHGATPGNLMEALALTHVFEKHVARQFLIDLENPITPAAVAATLQELLNDERQHLDWIAAWLKGRPGAINRIRHYTEVDEAISTALTPFEDRLWEVPGLGIELSKEAHLAPSVRE